MLSDKNASQGDQEGSANRRKEYFSFCFFLLISWTSLFKPIKILHEEINMAV